MRFRAHLALMVLGAVLLVAAPRARTQQGTTPKPFDLIEWSGGKFIYGVDYYPEAWDESQWEKDATMMQAAGINFVRLAEFAWAKMEPEAGRFDFAWLDRALKVLNSHGIRAVLGTPTASPPAWLYARFPDIAAMNENGVRYRFGSRRNYCLNHPAFRDATRRIVTAMAEHFKDHAGVLGWQIDNELGDPYCYDSDCQAAFQKWCRAKYQTLDELNKAWGTIFWGHTFLDWTQIPLPWNTLGEVHNPSLALDYNRFHSFATHDYLKFQTEILRKVAPSKAITHNEMGMRDQIDYSELNTSIDFVAWDNYPMFGESYASYFGPALAHDLMRGSKNNQNMMIMEEQAGLPGWTTFWGHQAAPGLFRVWAYQAIAHGADGVCYFRWRTSRYGTEQYWQGILDQDSYPNARYQVVSQMGKEVAMIGDFLRGSKVVSPVALLVSPATRWAYHIQPLVKDFDYNRQLHLYYDAFRREAISVDVLFPQNDFAPYKIIVAPSLFVVDKPLVEKLTAFVKDGGTLVLTYRSGVKDEHNVVTDQPLPGPLQELAGAVIHDFDPQTNQEQEIVELDGALRYPARVWFDVLDPTTAKPLANYGKGYYAGKAALTENHFGKGTVIYIGTESPSALFYTRLVGNLARQAEIPLGQTLPEGVELATREKAGQKILFLLNYTERPQTVPLGRPYRNLLAGKEEPAAVEIPPFDVKVLSLR